MAVIIASGIVSAVCLYALIVGLSPMRPEPGLRMSYELSGLSLVKPAAVNDKPGSGAPMSDKSADQSAKPRGA